MALSPSAMAQSLYWDGEGHQENNEVDGGDGTWQGAAGNSNWADTASGASNTVYRDGATAIFQGAAGTVTVDNRLGDVSVSALEFGADGYSIAGDTLTLGAPGVANRTIDVSVGNTATISASLKQTNASNFYKTGAGVLVLAGDNQLNTAAGTWSTQVNGGTLKLAGGITQANSVYVSEAAGASGSSLIVSAAGTTLNAKGNVGIGRNEGGSLLIEKGAVVNSSDGTVGFSNSEAKGTATATISGNGSQWNNAGGFIVANNANAVGVVNVLDGALLKNVSSTIGNAANASGTVNVDNARWTNDGAMTVGYSGVGKVDIRNGAQVSGTSATLGSLRNSSGTVAISDSEWKNSANLTVGGAGTGTVHINAGGKVSNYFGYIGATAGSTGTVTISGTGAQWNNSADLTVGNNGAGTLNIGAGGTVTSSGGLVGNSGGGTVTVSGAGALWKDSIVVAVGNTGKGTLNLDAGGKVTSPYSLIAASSSSVGKVTVIGTGTLWETTGDLEVGYFGNGTLHIEDGGRVTSILGVIGGYGEDAIGAVVIKGTGARWENATSLTVGERRIGALDIGAGGALTSATGVIGNLSGSVGTVAVDGLDALWQYGGDLVVGVQGSGTLTLSSLGTARGGGVSLAAQAGSTGTLNIGAGQGEGAVAAGVLDAPTLSFGAGTGTLNFNHVGEFGTDVVLSTGSGGATINQIAGTTLLNGNSQDFGGLTNVTGGVLRVNGTLGNTDSRVTVSSGGALGGGGVIGGSVTVDDGILSPGNSPGTLIIRGDLILGGSAILEYELGQADVAGGALNDLTVVHGDLTLDGTLNITQSAGGQYGAGVYRLIDYGGSLTDNGLELGNMPAGSDNYVLTAIAHQVNVVNRNGLELNWWDGDAGPKHDGVIQGGDGTWVASSTDTNWTYSHDVASGFYNGQYQDASFAIFSAAAGTVTVDNSEGAVRVIGMQFATDGYRIEGQDITLVAGTNALRVGDGTAAGLDMTATIAAALTGEGRLDKVDQGTLVLTGSNRYTGGTTISGGTLQLGDGGETGSIVAGDIANAGTLAFNRADAIGFDGAISGAGGVAQLGGGSTTLGGTNTYLGGTAILNGMLIGSANSFGGGAIANAATLELRQASDATFGNAIHGSGNVVKSGAGTLTLTGGNTYRGTTTVAAGDLQAGIANAFSANSAHAVASGGTLGLGGFDQTVASLVNGGTVAFAGATSAVGTTLTVQGDYVGNGGTLQMNTVFGGDDSVTDRLVVEGDTRGNTFVQVSNAHGAGAQTDNGIQLVSVAGASDGRFELQGRAVAGLYDYQLYQGGKHTPGDGDWYLRSEVIDQPGGPVDPIDPPDPVDPIEPPDPINPVDPVDPVNPINPVDPTNPIDPVNPVDPIAPIDPAQPEPPVQALRPEPAAYLGNQNAALRMFQHTMHDRVGEPGLGAREDGRGYAAWVRVQNRNLDAGTVGGQIAIDTHATVVQMGVEKQFAAGEGRVHAGVMGGYGRATTDGSSNFTDHRARGEVKGTNLGVYGTWFQNAEGPEGLYVDSWAQYGRFDNTVKGDYLGREQYDSRTWSGSVEAGYAMRVHSGEHYGIYVEPQAQVIYTDFSSDDVREDNGTLVQSRKAGGTTTRLGARLYSRPLSSQYNRVQPFAAVNWWSGGNASAIAMDGERLSRDLPKNTYEAKVGAQLELGKGWSGWGQVGYQEGSNGYRDVNGQIGVKLSW